MSIFTQRKVQTILAVLNIAGFVILTLRLINPESHLLFSTRTQREEANIAALSRKQLQYPILKASPHRHGEDTGNTIVQSSQYGSQHGSQRGPQSAKNHEPLPLPDDYVVEDNDDQFCKEKFSTEYLRHLSGTMTEYCDSGSSSSLKCFHTNRDRNGRIDSFCMGGPAAVSRPDRLKLTLDCKVKENPGNGAPKFINFPLYWYNTGPRRIFSKYFNFLSSVSSITESTAAATIPPPMPNYSILVQREGDSHIWHQLMEIFAMYMSIDVLQITRDPHTGEPLYDADTAAKNTQVVVLDDHPDGPFLELWGIFSEKPIIRASDVLADGSQPLMDNVIVPLPGHSNPQWQADWDVFPCTHGELLESFTHRVLNHFGIDNGAAVKTTPEALSTVSSSSSLSSSKSSPQDPQKLIVTFINRTNNRKLVNQSNLLSDLRSAFPYAKNKIEVREIDFAALPLAEQLQLVRETDVLVGVHGAGLTHAMFLPPGGAVVEILPPGLKHKGFRNLALMRGHRYFSTHGVRVLGDEGDEIKGKEKNVDPEAWHWEDVRISRESFTALLDAAVKSVFNRKMMNIEIV